MAMSVMSVLAVLAGLCLFAEVSAQTIKPCNGTVPSQPFVYNVSKINENICPLAGIQKDALLCIPRLLSLSIDYSITGVGGPKVCLIRNITTFCDEAGEGEFDGLLIVLNNFPMSGKLEISVGVLDIYYGNGSRPLYIMSGKNLSISGSLVIEERVFDQLGLTYVCEILDGQIIRSNLSTNLGSSDCLKPAVGSGRFDSGFAQSLTLLSPASSQPRIVTLFLTDDITCSSMARRLSNEFTVKIVISPTPGTPIDPMSPPSTESAIIGGSVGVVLLLIIVVIVVTLVVIWCRKKSTRTADMAAEDRNTLELSSVSSKDGNETDSGVGWSSPGPSTPVKCQVFVVCKLAGTWYTELKSALGTAFDSTLTELVLTDDADRFAHDAHAKLEAPNVKHLLFIQNMDESNHPSSFQEVITYFESRSCNFSKVWDIRLGAPEEFMIPKEMLKENARRMHMLSISQSNASSSGEDCAKEIHRRISCFDLQRPSDGALTTKSLGPHQWPAVEQNNNTASVPIQRKEFETQVFRVVQGLQMSVDELNQKTGDLAKTTGKIAKTTDKMAVTTDRIADTTKRTGHMVEDLVTKQEEATIVDLDNPKETPELTNEPTES